MSTFKIKKKPLLNLFKVSFGYVLHSHVHAAFRFKVDGGGGGGRILKPVEKPTQDAV